MPINGHEHTVRGRQHSHIIMDESAYIDTPPNPILDRIVTGNEYRYRSSMGATFLSEDEEVPQSNVGESRYGEFSTVNTNGRGEFEVKRINVFAMNDQIDLLNDMIASLIKKVDDQEKYIKLLLQEQEAI